MSTLTQVNAKSCAKLQHFQQIPINSTDNLRNSDVKPANWLHKLLVKKAQLIIKPLSPHPLCIQSSLIPRRGLHLDNRWSVSAANATTGCYSEKRPPWEWQPLMRVCESEWVYADYFVGDSSLAALDALRRAGFALTRRSTWAVRAGRYIRSQPLPVGL